MKWRDGLTFTKDPDSNEPRGLDWTLYLEAIDAAETITASTWTVSAGTLTLNSPSIVTGAKKTQVRYAAGTAGFTYTVTNRITTSSGVIDEWSFNVRVQQR